MVIRNIFLRVIKYLAIIGSLTIRIHRLVGNLLLVQLLLRTYDSLFNNIKRSLKNVLLLL